MDSRADEVSLSPQSEPKQTFDRVVVIARDFMSTRPNNGRLGEGDLIEVFDVWWPKLKQRIETITIAPQPVLKEPSEKELLKEILGLTRSLVRELQPLPPWQRFPLDAETVATVAALLRRDKPTTKGGILYEADKPTTTGGILGGTTTLKSE